jgi:flagellar biosynthesis component FlhA
VFRRDNKNSVLNGFGTIFVVIKVLTKTKFIMKTLSKMLVILALLVAGTAVGGYAQDKPKPKEKEKEKKEQSEKKQEHKEHKEKKDEKKKEKPKS